MKHIEEDSEDNLFKLICIPYSGGSSEVFARWDDVLGGSFKVLKFDYPKLEFGCFDGSNQKLDDLVYDVLNIIKGVNGPYAIFGHSMGAVITYLAASKTKAMGFPDPTHVILSGFEPPHIYFARHNEAHKLSDDSFIEVLKKMESIPKALLENPRALKLYLPAIRHDFYLLESYNFRPDRLSLGSKVAVFIGKDDPITQNVQRSEWLKYSTDACEIYDFEGNHFFIESYATQVASTVREILDTRKVVLK